MLDLNIATYNDSNDSVRLKADRLLGKVNWIDNVTGYCSCPGQHKHTTTCGEHDCRVKIDGIPTTYCVHASCGEEIAAANKTLRIGNIDSTPLTLTAVQKKEAAAAKAKARLVETLKVRAQKSVPEILKQYGWPYVQIIKDSPIQNHEEDRLGMFRAYTDMFNGDDIIWIGDVSDTGKPEHAGHFKTKTRWLEDSVPVGPYTCPACFVPDSFSRAKTNVAAQRYLVVESDILKKDEVGAIFRWLDRAVELPLRAVIDTAGKSLHGWFEFPPGAILAELKVMLPAMGCDPKMFTSSQPCRLPGGFRDGRIQRLIYSVKGGGK
jgi:hypothetical protein